MEIYRKKLFVLIVIIVVYLLIDIGLQNAAIYLVGGIIGGTIKEIIKLLGFVPIKIVTYSIWIIILAIFILIKIRAKSWILQMFMILCTGFLLYIIDFILIEVAINQSFILIIAIFIRSLILTYVTLKSTGKS